ncbi:MAG: hypothetical protein JXR91_14615 [Deltaproteobacteria bacterium]|nr:hypothetical protein [Deltaproteobacteria bacterium]
MNLRINSFLVNIILSLFFISITGCAARQKVFSLPDKDIFIKTVQPPADKDILKLAPDSAEFAMIVDFNAVNKSALKPILKILIQSFVSIDFPQAELFTLLNSSKQLLLVSGHSQSGNGEFNEEFLIIIKSKTEILSLLKKLKTAYGASTIDLENREVYEKGNIAATDITEKTLVLGSRNYVQSTILLVNGIGNHLKSSPQFKTFSLNKKSAVFKYLKNEHNMFQIINTFSRTGLSFAKDIINSEGTVLLKNGIDGNISLEMNSEKSASDAKRILSSQWNTLLANPFLKLLSIGWLKTKIKFSSSGKTVNIKVKLNNSEVNNLNKIITPLLQIQNLMESMQ